MRLILCCLLFPFSALAQKKISPKTYANTISAADLKKHLYIIAGPEMEGRETATEGERRAAAYITDHFKKAGLLPGNNGNYLLPFPLYSDTLSHASITVNNKTFEPGKDFIAVPGTHSTTMQFSEVVYLGAKHADTADKTYMTGKVVIASGQNAIWQAYAKAPAVMMVIDNKLPAGGFGGIKNKEVYPGIQPLVYTISENLARAMMGDNYADTSKSSFFKPVIHKTNITIDHQKRTNKKFSANVLGLIEGTDKKDEYLFITAHYDHEGKRADGRIFYGADDDGSGTVAILEIAEAFMKAKAAGHGPRRTIVFMPVSGEEKGLWGSEYYSENPVFPLEKTTADLNIDMIGRIDPDFKGDSLNYVYTIGDNKLSSDLSGILDVVNKKYTKLQIDRRFNDPKDPNRFYYRSDHYNFAKKGVPIIFFFNGVHADYHKTTDTPDKINYTLLEKRARLIFHTAWEMANRNEMIKRDIPLN